MPGGANGTVKTKKKQASCANITDGSLSPHVSKFLQPHAVFCKPFTPPFIFIMSLIQCIYVKLIELQILTEYIYLTIKLLDN